MLMSKFKPGDIVRCLRDLPYGAAINKGELAIIVDCNENDHVHFNNYPSRGFDFHWSGEASDFKLDVLVEANE